ncbi:MAG: alpha/beta hydrolase [Bacteroidota bacterium]
MKFKRKPVILLIFVLLIGAFFLGPRPNYPDYTPEIAPVQLTLLEVENHIATVDQAEEGLRPGNGSIFEWANGQPEQTEYCVLFLHGFTAVPFAGSPGARDFARRYGCNYYAPRLYAHGIEGQDAFKDLSPADLINSAKEALAIARILGKKTIVVGSSTGCTLAAYLAAYNPDYVHSMLFFSPNIDLAAATSKMLLWPWGKQIARLVIGGDYRTVENIKGKYYADYWYVTYHIDGLLALKYLIQETMREKVFEKIQQPLYLGYYYRDEEHKDEAVSIPRMKDFFAQVGTPEEQKRIEAVGEAGGHIMLSNLQCDSVAAVCQRAYAFAEDVLRLLPVAPREVAAVDSLPVDSE